MFPNDKYNALLKSARRNAWWLYAVTCINLYAGASIAYTGLTYQVFILIVLALPVATSLYWRQHVIGYKLAEAVRDADGELSARIASRTQKDYIELHNDYVSLLEKYHDLWEYCEKLREFSRTHVPSSSLVHKQ